LATEWRALARGPGAFVNALGLIREHRELAVGVYRGHGKPRRLSALARRVIVHTDELAVILVTTAGLLVVAAALAGVHVDTGADAAFLAGLFDAVSAWWAGLSTFEKVLTILSVASLFTGGGLLFSGLLARGLIALGMRQVAGRAAGQLVLGSGRARVGTYLAQYVSRFVSREIKFAPKQSQKKYQKHAEVFKIDGNWNKAAPAKLQQAVDAHVRDPTTIVRRGSYHGEGVTHFYNPGTGINVIRTAGGVFLSAWKPGHVAVWHLLRYGKLGGG
jgi:Colicin D